MKNSIKKIILKIAIETLVVVGFAFYSTIRMYSVHSGLRVFLHLLFTYSFVLVLGIIIAFSSKFLANAKKLMSDSSNSSDSKD